MARTRDEYNAYMREYMKRRYAERRAEAVVALGGKCAKCEGTEGLQIDHIDPAEKSADISQLFTYSEEKLQAELAKCQLLCDECHEEKSIVERGHSPARGTHGTLSAYRYCGPPKCEACKRAKRLYARQHKPDLRRATAA